MKKNSDQNFLIFLSILIVLGSISDSALQPIIESDFILQYVDRNSIDVNKTILFFRLGIVFLIIPLTIKRNLQIQKENRKSITRGMETIFNEIFDRKSIENNSVDPLNDNNAYRITYYFKPTRSHEIISVLGRPLKYFWYSLLNIITFQSNRYTKRNQKFFSQDRWLNLHDSYLICKYRYGFERGREIKNRTSLLQLVQLKDINTSDFGTLFGGKTFMLRDEILYTYSLENQSINNIIEKIENNESLKKTDLIRDLKKTNRKSTIETHIAKIENIVKDVIDDTEMEDLVSFMRETNTPSYSLFGINKGFHSKFFLGFKVFDIENKPIGVVVIDAYDREAKSFLELLKIDNLLSKESYTEEQIKEIEVILLQNMLKGYSSIFSRLLVQ